MPALKRAGKRGNIHDAAAAQIEETRALLHRGKFTIAEKIPVLRPAVQMKRHHVASFEEFLE